MPEDLQQRVRRLFDEAMDRPEAERLAFLRAESVDDPEAFQAVARLLADYIPAQSFLVNPAPGMDRIGRYLISGELGRGAMGVVYEAVDPLIRRSLAVKVIHLQTLADRSQAGFMRDRLFREARSAGQLLHPGIVVIFDVGQEGELAFIAMERVDGSSLHQILASGKKFNRRETIGVLRETASALDHAHERNIVHCDVKPGNIMLDKSGTVKLTDFGIAKITSTQHHTRTGLLMGTPSYMSPEQIEGLVLDGKSDQFPLAVLAFQLLTGSLPFKADSIAGMAHAIVYGERPLARDIDPTIPANVDSVLARGLHKTSGNRFTSCSEFVTALEEALADDGVIALPLPPKRHAVGWPWYAAGALALAVASAGGYRLSHRTAVAVSFPPPPAVQLPAQPLQTMPVVVAFTAGPQPIKKGASATLRWEVKGASQVVIDPGPGAVGASGSNEITPEATTTYRLIANGPGGQTTTQTVQVVVESPPGAQAIFAKAMVERRVGRLPAALALFRQAAQQGETRAMVELGNLADGDGEGQSYSDASHWFRMAADHGDATGMLLLGSMYYLGRGVPQDYSAAADWFRKASDSGDPAGKFNLGQAYESGLGVVRDTARAEQLYRDAAQLGNEEAGKRLQRLSGGH